MLKQVIVVRKDLKMRRGKEIAQCCHASIAFLLNALKKAQSKPFELVNKIGDVLSTGEVLSSINFLSYQLDWMRSNGKKVCLQVNSEQELLDVYDKAKYYGLDVHLIEDEGLTEFHGVKTKTCLAIGPDDAEKIDLVTGGLSLY